MPILEGQIIRPKGQEKVYEITPEGPKWIETPEALLAKYGKQAFAQVKEVAPEEFQTYRKELLGISPESVTPTTLRGAELFKVPEIPTTIPAESIRAEAPIGFPTERPVETSPAANASIGAFTERQAQLEAQRLEETQARQKEVEKTRGVREEAEKAQRGLWERAVGLLREKPIEAVTREETARLGGEEDIQKNRALVDRISQSNLEIVDLEGKRDAELERIRDNPNFSMAFMGREETRVANLWNKQINLKTAQAQALRVEYEARRGNIADARALVGDIVQAVTADRRAKLEEFNFFYQANQDIINRLEKSEREAITDIRQDRKDELARLEQDTKDRMNLFLQAPEAFEGVNILDLDMEQVMERVAKGKKKLEEAKAPSVIGSAETGYQQWDAATKTWKPISQAQAITTTQIDLSVDNWTKLITVGKASLDDITKTVDPTGKIKRQVVQTLADLIPDPTNIDWVKKQYQMGKTQGLPDERIEADMKKSGVPEDIIRQVIPAKVKKGKEVSVPSEFPGFEITLPGQKPFLLPAIPTEKPSPISVIGGKKEKKFELLK